MMVASVYCFNFKDAAWSMNLDEGNKVVKKINISKQDIKVLVKELSRSNKS
jgi:hypothetical protein